MRNPELAHILVNVVLVRYVVCALLAVNIKE